MSFCISLFVYLCACMFQFVSLAWPTVSAEPGTLLRPLGLSQTDSVWAWTEATSAGTFNVLTFVMQTDAAV